MNHEIKTIPIICQSQLGNCCVGVFAWCIKTARQVVNKAKSQTKFATWQPMCEATWPMWVGLWNGLIFSLINNPFWCNTNLHLSTKVKFWFDHSATVWFICQQVYQNNSRLQNFNMFIKMFQTSKWHQCSHEQWWTSLPGDQGWVLSCYQTELTSLSVNKDTSYWNDKRKRNSIASFRCLLPQLDSPTILSGSVLVREKMWDMMTILLKQKVGQM